MQPTNYYLHMVQLSATTLATSIVHCDLLERCWKLSGTKNNICQRTLCSTAYLHSHLSLRGRQMDNFLVTPLLLYLVVNFKENNAFTTLLILYYVKVCGRISKLEGDLEGI